MNLSFPTQSGAFFQQLAGRALVLAAAFALIQGPLAFAQGAPGGSVNFRSIVPAPNSGATPAELGAATGEGLTPVCVKPTHNLTAVLHAPDVYDAATGIYAISATVGLLPRTSGPLLWPEDAYAVTRAAQGLDPAQRKQLALETVRQASAALCRTMAAPASSQAPR